MRSKTQGQRDETLKKDVLKAVIKLLYNGCYIVRDATSHNGPCRGGQTCDHKWPFVAPPEITLIEDFFF